MGNMVAAVLGGSEGEIAEGFTGANALAILLTTESLMFAALGLAFTASGGAERRIRTFAISEATLGACAVGVLVLIAVGAGAAWWEIFGADFPGRCSGRIIALAIGLAIVAEPILAFFFSLGLRKAK